MGRPAIPAEIRRAVLVEAGHRCAIPRCGQTEIDVHHIISWEECHKHEYENLIALCPVCHRRVHKGEIDRKSLLIYKSNLTKDIEHTVSGEFSAKVIEIKRRISETDSSKPGFVFNFDFPDFEDPKERVASKNLEAWGNELLAGFRERQAAYEGGVNDPFERTPSTLQGSYEVVRRDTKIISLKYSVDQYFTGAAHGGRVTRVQNFMLRPFQPVTLRELLRSEGSLIQLSDLAREKLLADARRNPKWVLNGTEPDEDNFSLFNIASHGIRFTFSEYQIDCYAAGEQELWLSFYELKEIIDQHLLSAVTLDE